MAPAFRDSGVAQGERRPGLRGGSDQSRLERAGQVGVGGPDARVVYLPGAPFHFREQTVLELGRCEGGHVGDEINAV